MLTVNLGPFPLSVAAILVIVALLVAAWAGRLAGRSQQISISNILIDMLVAAILVSRIAFVAVWFDTYRSSPWSIFDIRDGGFILWVGLLAALLVAAWRSWRRVPVRKPLSIGLAAGALAWAMMFGAISQLNNTMLPNVSLMTLAGEPVDLVMLAAGKPMVINLWASWCPPCRRELPDLQELSTSFKDKGLVVLGITDEDVSKVQPFVTKQGLTYPILLDAGRKVNKEFNVLGIPRTVIYNRQGHLAAEAIDMRTRPQLLALLAKAGIK